MNVVVRILTVGSEQEHKLKTNSVIIIIIIIINIIIFKTLVILL
jgi:hypothetical protein